MKLTVNLKSGLTPMAFEIITKAFGEVEISIYNDDYLIVSSLEFNHSNALLDKLIQFIIHNQSLVNKAILSNDNLTYEESVDLLHSISLKGLFYTINPKEGHIFIDTILIDENLWFVSLMTSLNFLSENTICLYEGYNDYYQNLEESNTLHDINTIEIYNTLYKGAYQKLKSYYDGNNQNLLHI